MSKRTSQQVQESLTFEYREQLDAIVRDMENIDRLIPAESSRCGCLMDSKKQGNEMAIIEARKSKLLTYIQTICRDHIVWSKKLLDKGWKVEHLKARRKLGAK